jgi:hypothetical protein
VAGSCEYGDEPSGSGATDLFSFIKESDMMDKIIQRGS